MLKGYVTNNNIKKMKDVQKVEVQNGSIMSKKRNVSFIRAFTRNNCLVC